MQRSLPWRRAWRALLDYTWTEDETEYEIHPELDAKEKVELCLLEHGYEARSAPGFISGRYNSLSFYVDTWIQYSNEIYTTTIRFDYYYYLVSIITQCLYFYFLLFICTCIESKNLLSSSPLLQMSPSSGC